MKLRNFLYSSVGALALLSSINSNAQTIPKDSIIVSTSKSDSLINLQMNSSICAPAYPNPTKSNLIIPYFSLKDESATLKIYSITGKCLETKVENVFGENTFELDMNNYQKGTYFYTVTTKEYSKSGKFLKN